jgi:hypothetical protein
VAYGRASFGLLSIVAALITALLTSAGCSSGDSGPITADAGTLDSGSAEAGKDSAVEDVASQDVANQDAANQDVANQDAANQDAANQDVANQDAANQDGEPNGDAAALAPGFFVATNGFDSNPGTLQAPFATLRQCQSAMRHSANIKTCYIRGGTYTVSQLGQVQLDSAFPTTSAIKLTSADSGTTWSYYPPDVSVRRAEPAEAFTKGRPFRSCGVARGARGWRSGPVA